MPLRKFRTIEEMNAAERDRWLDSGDPRLTARIRFVLGMGSLAPSLNFPKGVHKFRSIEEMNAFKERYENERFALIRQRVKK